MTTRKYFSEMKKKKIMKTSDYNIIPKNYARVSKKKKTKSWKIFKKLRMIVEIRGNNVWILYTYTYDEFTRISSILRFLKNVCVC